ncbi:hypothetical protein [Nocardia sp. alder85J]|uniref:hypothetical protein n=1 Tax=Nocardia sp. alder85J TaxID=2862949 RepID=UPI001CD435CC|nr:hypothetical protein [Nocardia sp. alder85J]MCX4095146.1 hypothetical protein [Nocardia sp. alder85J]
MDFEQYIDGPIILFGVADNSEDGAVLWCGPRALVHIAGLGEWPPGDIDATFRVSGTLIAEGDDADLHNELSEAMHGTGRRYLVRDAEWVRVSD